MVSGTRKKKRTSRNRTFKKSDLSSGDGMLTTVWGPSLWHTLHTISFNYPVHPTQREKTDYRNFILSLQKVLPCKYCRINLKRNFKNMPLRMCNMRNRDTFSRYIYALHEQVNKMLKKKSGLSYCDVRERYEHFRARCGTKKNKLFKFNKTSKRPEKGCTIPLRGEKAKCVIKIVPQKQKCSTFQMDDRCLKTRDEDASTKRSV